MERQIVSAGLFKNGLAVMTEEIVVPGAGTYRLDDPPIPLHGTWWVESDARVETTATEAEVEVPLPAGELFAFQRSLAGRRVELLLRGEPVPIGGTVAAIESPRTEREWDRTYRQERHSYWFGSARVRPVADASPTVPSGFLVLEQNDGTTSFIDTSSIVRIDVAAGGLPKATTTVRSPALLFDCQLEPHTPDYHPAVVSDQGDRVGAQLQGRPHGPAAARRHPEGSHQKRAW